MDEFLTILINEWPAIAGLAILALVLYRQNEKLLNKLFIEFDELRRDVTEIKQRLRVLEQLNDK